MTECLVGCIRDDEIVAPLNSSYVDRDEALNYQCSL